MFKISERSTRGFRKIKFPKIWKFGNLGKKSPRHDRPLHVIALRVLRECSHPLSLEPVSIPHDFDHGDAQTPSHLAHLHLPFLLSKRLLYVIHAVHCKMKHRQGTQDRSNRQSKQDENKTQRS